MSFKAEAKLGAAQDVLMRAIGDILREHPEARAQIAQCLMGVAMGFCDTVGISPEDELRKIRREVGRLPYVMVPPKERQS
jgi:hypothetical protein